MKKRLLRWLLAVVLVLGMIPGTVFATEATEPGTPETVGQETLSFTAQTGGAFLIPPQIDAVVSGDLAERYGYTDQVSSTNVSALDVLVKAHEVCFGEDFTADTANTYLAMAGNFVEMMFGVDDSNICILVNGAMPGDSTVNQAQVNSGDLVEFAWYQDTIAWSDNYVWLEKADGGKLDGQTVTAGDTVNVIVKGYSLISYGFQPQDVIDANTAPISGAKLAWVDISTGELTELSITSDTEGKATVTVPTDYAGSTRYLTACGDDMMMTLAAVSVKAAIPGSGTEEDPYLLENAAHLDRLDALVSEGETFEGKYFKITNDITVSNGWDGIGYAKVEVVESWGSLIPTTKEFKPFAGILDGQNHTLTFPTGSQPLFDCVRTATIKNIKISGDIADDGLIANYAQDGYAKTADISGITVLSGTKIAGSGLLGGYASGSNVVTITNCHIEEGVTVGSADASNIGGIAGDFNGTISNSTCSATVYGKDFVGGIVGGQGQSLSATTISDCTFSGEVIATGNYVGGISGCGYTGTGWGFSPNAGCIDIKNCTVTGSITGGDYVGGILGAEPAVVQCWENGIGEISDNVFTGTITSDGQYIGGVIGFMKSINRYNIISGNSYKPSENVTRGIGGATYVDTNHSDPTAVEGVTYVNSETTKTGISGMTKTAHNRTDDPLGADKDNLAKEIKPVVSKLEISGDYKAEYIQGDELDLSKAVFTATWSDGSTSNPALAEITVQGYDAQKVGEQKITLTYGAASCEITVTVKEPVKTIEVSFALLGDSAHGDSGTKHTLVDNNLTTWIAKTTYTVGENATVLDVFTAAAEANGVTFENASGNYITSVTKDGVTLASLTNGASSGWMYTLNGVYPNYSVAEQYVKDGDVIVFHYTDDYNREYNGGDAEEPEKPEQPEEPVQPQEPTTPMYRLYNPNSGEHFYTGSSEERDMLVNAGWNYEGIAWNAPVRTGTPVYRVYNPNSGDHHYTMSQEEVDNLVALGWKYEGVAWNSAEPDAIPQFRLYNPNADVGSHHYTSSTEERDYLVSLGWRFEGIGWFGLLQ